LLPPATRQKSGRYHIGQSTTNRVAALVRALPINGDNAGAFEKIKTVKFYPLDPKTPWKPTEWADISYRASDLTPGTIG
jgi:hypothetical protein